MPKVWGGGPVESVKERKRQLSPKCSFHYTLISHILSPKANWPDDTTALTIFNSRLSAFGTEPDKHPDEFKWNNKRKQFKKCLGTAISNVASKLEKRDQRSFRHLPNSGARASGYLTMGAGLFTAATPAATPIINATATTATTAAQAAALAAVTGSLTVGVGALTIGSGVAVLLSMRSQEARDYFEVNVQPSQDLTNYLLDNLTKNLPDEKREEMRAHLERFGDRELPFTDGNIAESVKHLKSEITGLFDYCSELYRSQLNNEIARLKTPRGQIEMVRCLKSHHNDVEAAHVTLKNHLKTFQVNWTNDMCLLSTQNSIEPSEMVDRIELLMWAQQIKTFEGKSPLPSELLRRVREITEKLESRPALKGKPFLLPNLKKLPRNPARGKKVFRPTKWHRMSVAISYFKDRELYKWADKVQDGIASGFHANNSASATTRKSHEWWEASTKMSL